jgi:SOUL heme-binding protein
MKALLIVFAVIITIFFLFQFYMLRLTNKTEEQKYDVVHKDKDFEIRFYPATTLATVNSDAKTYRELSGPGFRKLAGYIFGGNESKTKISMTSPVHMDINDTVSTMSFVMPSDYHAENLPKPSDPNIIINKTADEYVAAIRFGGFASDSDLKKYSEKLLDLLKGKGITAYGHCRYLGYNPPFQFIGRRNEIIISVDWNVK